MSITSIFIVQVATSVLVFALVARWYWAPRLAPLGLVSALTPLLLLHGTRTLGLTFLVPGVVSSHLPQEFAVPAAYGDFLAAILALLSILALRARLPLATIVVWIFSVEGMLDLANDFIQGGRFNIAQTDIGAGWYILTVLVPALIVTHVMVVTRLWRELRGGAGERAVARVTGGADT